MKPLTLALSLALSALALSACAEIGDPQDTTSPGDPGGDPDDPVDPALCVGDGGSGATCEVSGDCDEPFVCLDGVCVGPRNPDVTCDPVEHIYCQDPDEVCVGRVCVRNPGSCETTDDCPLGYTCDGGTCTPQRDGETCADPGPGPDLSGTWKFSSTLHLRDGLPGVVDGILTVAENGRNLITGDVDLGLPSIVESVIGGVVASIIDNYVPQYAQNLVVALGDMSDILDDMEVESTVTLDGQPCDGNYRGHERWDLIHFEFRGNDLTVRPDQLPGIDEIVPEDFAAWYSCGELYIDRHRIKNSLSGLVRFLVDNIANAVTGYPDVESALANMVDCYGFAVALDDYVGQVCSFCPIVTSIVDGACTTLVNQGIQRISEEIDKASVEMSVVKKKGIAAVNAQGQLSGGTWYGTLAGNDFPGEFSAVRE